MARTFWQTEAFREFFRKAERFEIQRYPVDARRGRRRNHVGIPDSRSPGNLFANVVRYFHVGTEYEEIRRDSISHEFPNRVLHGLGLEFLARPEIGQKGDVDEQGVLLSELHVQLSGALEQVFVFHVSYRPPDFHYRDVRLGRVVSQADFFLYQIGYVRYDLYRSAQIFPLSFPGNDFLVDLSGRER